MPHRSMEHLRREQLSPPPIQEGGRGKVALYDFNALCFFAATGAILKVSSSITFAAKLAKVLIDELALTYGQVPFGRSELDSLIRSLNLDLDNLFDADGNVIPLAVIRVLRDNPEIHNQGQIRESDYKILILDGRYILSTTLSKIEIFNGIKLDEKWWQPEMILNPTRRGTDVTVTHLSEMWTDDTSQINSVFAAAYAVAETKVEINLGLPIRNALDAIYDIRMEAVSNIGGRD